MIRLDIHHHKNKNEYKVDHHHPNGAIKAVNIAPSDALGEEDTVVIVVIDTDVTIFTVVHVLGHIDIALYTVQNSLLLPVFVFSNLICGLIVLRLFSLLKLMAPFLLAVLRTLRVFNIRIPIELLRFRIVGRVSFIFASTEPGLSVEKVSFGLHSWVSKDATKKQS